MEVKRLYPYPTIDTDEIAFYLVLTKEEIDNLKLGRKALSEMTMAQNTYHANAILDYVFPLIDKISEAAK